MSNSIETLRQDTPGCEQILHFNNAGAALMPLPVIQALKQHIDLEAVMGGYEAQNACVLLSEKIYTAAAQLINCHPDEIAFMENATRAWDMIFYSFKFNKNDRILTCKSEYASNYLAFLQMKKRTGVIIEVVKDDDNGQVDIADLENKIREDVKLIAMTHIPTQGGLINPAEAIGSIAAAHHIPYLLDTTQSIGQMPVDVKTIGCDFLCATGRKFLRGPRGTGFLYAKKERLLQCDPPFIDLHAAQWDANNHYTLEPNAKRFETWEQNIAAKIGLGVAIEYALNLGMSYIWTRIQFLSQCLREQLQEISGVTLRDLGKDKCGIVTFTCANKSAEEVQKLLKAQKINVSVSLQEYARLDLASRNLDALVRASVHYYNTEEEVERFCKMVAGV